MTTVKRITELTSYAGVLPYASELFGVYQPLLGWNSKRSKERFEAGFKNDRRYLMDKYARQFSGLVDVTYKPDNQVEIQIAPGVMEGGRLRAYDSLVLQKIAEALPPYQELKDADWRKAINPDRIQEILQKDVVETYSRALPGLTKPSDVTLKRGGTSDAPLRSGAAAAAASAAGAAAAASRVDTRSLALGAFEHQLQHESAMAGMLLALVKNKDSRALSEIFYSAKNTIEQAAAIQKVLSAGDSTEAYLSLEHLNPTDREQLKGVVLSPIGVVHLFRQYFFELDTFLGTPESHVWLSPGSSVELIEVHTRRQVVERTLETTLELLTRSEKSTTSEEEISEAVKQDNDQDIKFGASVKASYASIEATSSFDYANSQKMARENTHRTMRTQTEKLSSEIRKNFKSTFKTVTEFTDLSSTKHLMANSTDHLINYELRRKMRQVGVQVQDIGTFLCWQTYVDDPGRELGLSKLIHIAKPADLDAIPHPQEIPLLEPIREEKIVTIPFISIEGTDADNEGEVYKDGVEVDDSEWFGNLEKIQSDFKMEFVAPRANYGLTNVEFDPQGKPVTASRRGGINNSNDRATFVLHLDSADFQGQNSLQVKVALQWSPSGLVNQEIADENKKNVDKFNQAEKAAFDKAMIETVKERVTLASKITTRKGEELREEERIVIYRKLIQDMLLKGVSFPDDRTRHVAAELINSIFDVDKMLYFVAPEWWRPRLHRSRQQLGEKPEIVSSGTIAGTNKATKAIFKGIDQRIGNATINAAPGLMDSSTVGWGGVDDNRRDNYYITSDSDPAKLGSSLGWLLQLDGDNLRNAFLNAPWVKAVIPIRPGKEAAAINWLKGVEGMNGITDDVIYHASTPGEKDIHGNPLEGQKFIDVLFDLAAKVKKKYQEGLESGKYPKVSEVSDPSLVDEENTVTATPIDRVYEHGFYPLQNSFRLNVGKNYEIFDQWIEILPTDQIVPVEVTYDPKTGRQK